MIDRAIQFAAHVHKGMYRKGNKQPYIFHPLEVLSLVSMMTDDDDILCAAVLHDTVEDTPATIEDIRTEFGERVAMNSPIQGTAADIMKIAMINVWKTLREQEIDAKVLVQVHDELLLEVKKLILGKIVKEKL